MTETITLIRAGGGHIFADRLPENYKDTLVAVCKTSTREYYPDQHFKVKKIGFSQEVVWNVAKNDRPADGESYEVILVVGEK